MIDVKLDPTILGAGKRGPALKNRHVGDGEMHKGLLNREFLRANDGVKCFKDTPTSLKELREFFHWRFHRLSRARKGNIEMVKWIDKFTMLVKLLRNVWMDMPPVSVMSHE